MKPDQTNCYMANILYEELTNEYGGEYYPIDFIALKRANLTKYGCETVQKAKKRGLPRWDIADFFLLQLKTAIELETIEYIGEWVESNGFNCEYVYLVHKDILSNWPALNYPSIPKKVIAYLKILEGHIAEDPPTQPETTKRKKTSYDPDEPPPRSVYSVLGLLLADLKYFEKYDEQGRKGGQDRTITHMKELAEKYHVSDKGLSKSNLQRVINTALDVMNSSFLPDKRQ